MKLIKRHSIPIYLYVIGIFYLFINFSWSISSNQEIDLEDCSMQALGQTADWFRRALAVEPVKGNLRLSGYSACGQDGGVQLPREYVEGILINFFLLLGRA